MSESKRNPFEAAGLHGEETLTIFSGGACLKVWGAHADLQVAWDWFEKGLETPEHCKVALRAVYDVRNLLRLQSSFYHDGADALTVASRLKVLS